MNDEADTQADAQARDNAIMDAWLQPRLERAERVYGQALTSLWVGNAGASLATLSFIGAAWKNDAFPKVLLWPLGLFVLGVILMGVGALITLWREKRVIERMEQANSPKELFFSDIQLAADSIGLTLSDGRTAMALLSGCCFVAGCVVGFVMLAIRAG